MADVFTGEVGYEEFYCYGINSANSYEEALNRVAEGGAEFVEFPLDNLGSFGRELIDLMDTTITPYDNYTSIKLPMNYHNPIEDELWEFTEQTLNISNKSLTLSIVNKINEATDFFDSHSSHIKKLGGRHSVTASIKSTNDDLKSLSWHVDISDTPYIRTIITIKGESTKFCQLSSNERTEFNEIGQSIIYIPDFPDDLDTKLCTDESSIFQIKPYHGAVFRASDNLPSIHSAPDYIGHRVTLMVETYT